MTDKSNLCGKEELIRTAVGVGISISEPSKLGIGAATYDVIRTSWNCGKRLKKEIKDRLNNEQKLKPFEQNIDPKYLRICPRDFLKYRKLNYLS